MWNPLEEELFFDFETGTLNTTVYYDFASEGNIPVSHVGVLIPTVAPNLPSAQLQITNGTPAVTISTIKPSLEGIFPLIDITYLSLSEGVYSPVVVTEWESVPLGKRISGFNADPVKNFVYDLQVVATGVTPPPASVPLVYNRTFKITILQQYNTNRDILLQKVAEEDTNDGSS